MNCRNCGQQNPDNARFCQSCGMPIDDAAGALDMGWHRFIVNFALIASAIYNAYQGIVLAFGFGYGTDREFVYRAYPGLQLVDALYGIALICSGGLCFYLRMRLKNFKANGPALVPLLYAFNILTVVLYLVAVSAMAGIDPVGVATVANIGASIAMGAINTSYYKKRKHLFVN